MLQISTKEHTDRQHFKQKAFNAVLSFGSLRLLTQVIQTISSVIIARILFPADLGKVALIVFFISIFTTLFEPGLSQAIVQSKKTLTTIQLRQIFTANVVLGLAATVLFLLIAPSYNHLYMAHLGQRDLPLLLIGCFGPLLYNLKVVPRSLLERSLHLWKLTVGDLLELLALQLITVYLVILGFGVASFVWGILLSRSLAVVIFFILQPWSIGLAFSLSEIKKFVTFGSHIEANNVVGIFYGSLAPVVIGGIAGNTALGLVNWASGVGAAPRAIGDVVSRLVFTIGSRAQTNKPIFKITLERSIQLTNIISLPIITIMLALAQPLTYILFTSKWNDGLPSLYLFIIQSNLFINGFIITQALIALGHIKIVRNINLLSVISQWLLTLILINYVSFHSFALAGFLTSLLLFIPLYYLKKQVPVELSKYWTPYIIYSGIAGLLTYIYSRLFPITSISSLILTSLLGLTIYICLIYIFEKATLQKNFLTFYQLLFKNKS